MPAPSALAPPRTLVTQSARWRLTAHLRNAAARRGVTIRQVLDVVEKPDITYTQEDYGPGRQMRQRGRLAVVVAQDTCTVITVLLRAPHRWTDEEARACSAANNGGWCSRCGRDFRELSSA